MTNDEDDTEKKRIVKEKSKHSKTKKCVIFRTRIEK